jgi:predicted dehydrogenase
MTNRDESGRLRVALVGAGMISEHHLRAWARLPDAVVVAVVDPDPARRTERARQFEIAYHYPDMEALFAGVAIDALDIASPRDTHAALVRQAAKRGLPVLCQKPLAPTHAEAEALVRDVGSRIRLMVHENWRFRPYYRRMGAWIASGAFGALTSGSISLSTSGLLADAAGRYPALERQPFMRSEARLLVAETLIHHLDVARWLLGPLSVVAARLVRATDAVVGESVATILLETAAGAPLVVSGTLVSPGSPPFGRDRVELVGTRGSIAMENDLLHFRGGSPAEVAYEHAQAYQGCFNAAIAHFVRCLQTGEPFETDAGDNLETLSLVEQVYAAAQRLRPGTYRGLPTS